MNIETDWPPIEVMFMYKIIEKIGNLVDKAKVRSCILLWLVNFLAINTS